MFHLDNSETSWLVYADWLEDQDIDATHIRQEVINPTSDGWSWIEPDESVGGYNGYGNVGDVGSDGGVGGCLNFGVGQY